ncbi:hypothetical protein D3C81_2275910 [compost metagenome]
MLPLRPVAAAVEHVQFGIGDAGDQAQAGVHRHEAIVTPPDNQRLRLDFAQARTEVRELFRIDGMALDEIFQVVPT